MSERERGKLNVTFPQMGCQFGNGKKLFRFGVKDQKLFNAGAQV